MHMIMIGVAAVVVGLGTIVAVWRAYRIGTAIEATGITAPGEVVAKDSVLLADNDWSWTVTYRFTPPGGPAIEATRSIRQSLWNDLANGSRIAVCYDPRNPRHNFPKREGATSAVLCVFATLVGLAFVAAGVVFIVTAE
jgi:hypothetical protein